MSVPRSTYRLQLHSGFDFNEAARIADYLRDLGISHVYCSPYLQAAPGSMHGYDVVDYHRVNSELGGKEAYAKFCLTLGQHRLGQVLDIVPNHMAITGHHNIWWWDTLENGASSRYAPYFDIDWNAPEERLRNKIVLPVLGDHYGRVLEARELSLERREGTFVVRYYEHTYPVAPESMSGILGRAADQGPFRELGFLADSLAHLPGPRDSDWDGLLGHDREKEVIGMLLTRLCEEHPEIARSIDTVIAETNQDINALDSLLSRQNYRLCRWRTAESELVYRRFFDINSLVGVRTEDERVFADTHQLILEWLRSGVIDGVRVDHPDGLRDPDQYFHRLRAAAPSVWIVAEKILQPGERLPKSWDVAGTTGYDFLNLAGGLFVDTRGEAPLNELYREFTGEPVDFAATARDKKLLVVKEILGSDVNRLTALLVQICETHREHRDYTRHELHESIRALLACFPVYRTYVQAHRGEISETDVRYISQAIDSAKLMRPDLDQRLFEFLRDILLLRAKGPLESEFVMRFQQITAAAMAKGVEDTAFYTYLRLTALNEVGGDPGRFGVAVDDFHKWCEATQAQQPFTLLATSTHDTKRNEDVRMRICLLSEVPAAWAEAVRRWSGMNTRHRSGDLPDRKTEYLLYQTLVGAWPISKDRLTSYMKKAVREAKEHTSWIHPNGVFEEALDKFISELLADAEFLADLGAFLDPLVGPARIHSLSLNLLKLTAPGVPDLYQGTELWDLSLVDPDNRRPVDYELRRRLLSELDGMCPEPVLNRSDEGLPKLFMIRQTLRIRNLYPDSFGASASYRPLWATGPKASHVIAFERGGNVISVAPRLVMGRGAWDDTLLEIPEGTWENQFTGDTLPDNKVELNQLLKRFPVALLTRS